MKTIRFLTVILSVTVILSLTACGHGGTDEPADLSDPATETGASQTEPPTGAQNSSAAETESAESRESEMRLFIENTEVSVEWEDNKSVGALIETVKDEPLRIETAPYGGFEQVGSLGTTLPKNDRQIKTAPGDIVLYSGNQIVIFYGSNSWAYTPLGRITGKSADELADLLGGGNITVTLSYGG